MSVHNSQLNDKLPELSIVLPCYNEEEIIADFIAEVATIAGNIGLPFEILAVNDGSSDGTYDELEKLRVNSKFLRVLHFSRNFGHMAALTAGLDHSLATGAVITMDSDGQHPPSLIPELIARWKSGVDIVQTVRLETHDASFRKRLTSVFFYSILNRLSDTAVLAGAADFRLMSRQAVDALNTMPEKARFIRGLVFWIGFKMETVEFSAPARIGGTTKYSFGKMMRFAIDGITSFSTVLLRLSILAGLFAVALAMIYVIYIIIVFLFFGSHLVSGWSSLMLTVLFLGGLNLIFMGILGEYISRIYSEVKNRPIYILKD